MKQSQMLAKTRREVGAKETSTSARLLLKGGYIDQTMAGVYTILPLGYRVLRKIEDIVRQEMQNLGAEEILMPSLHPKDLWQTTGRWDTMDNLFRFESYFSKAELALGPTHEEVVTPLAKKFIASYKDLPRKVFQIQTKFRDEKRAKSGILRGREFLMKDLYSFHSSEQDLDDFYTLVEKAYERIFERLWLGTKTLKTYASGGSFTQYSHEYQTLSDIGEDTIYVCHKCNVAINQEIIADQKVCPQCQSSDLEERTAIEVGNIFKLKDKFSSSFGLTFQDTDGTQKPVLMGCYGIGISRLLGTLAQVLAENENKILWPDNLAPFDIHLISLNETFDDEVYSQAKALYDKMKTGGREILWDDRLERAGVKFSDADLYGIPHRMIVSKKSLINGGFELNGEIITI
jgi:prolyl-tRNA synthetase